MTLDDNLGYKKLKVSWMNAGTNFELEISYSSDTSIFDIIDASDTVAVAVNAVKERTIDIAPVVPAYVPTPDVKTYKGTCVTCGKVETVKFKPNSNRAFYCNDCYSNSHK